MRKAILLIFVFFLVIASVQALVLDDSLQDLTANETVRISLAISDNVSSSFFKVKTAVDKDEVINDLKENYNVEYVAQTFNALTVEVNGSELQELKERKDILEIKKALDFHTLLQDSNSIINSTLAGNLQTFGVNLTGQGQTVCIIDSGVNYTHPSLGNCTTQQFLAGNCSKVIGGWAYYNPVNASNQNDVMGDSDHGTHVAGIAAGNGQIRGIAPDAKIVSIKACGPTSSCDGNAIIDGINWCTSNKTLFNISVISISIGTSAPDLYNTYCDDEIPSFTSAINAAAAKNISVVVAAGNDGNRTHISLPACITNATAVGATTKSDALNFNRNYLVKLVAPGVNINSTFLSGYGLDSGTSMATPHVSGALIVLNQLINFLNVKMQPSQLTQILNNSGKTITDSTGVNYSRINLYSAVMSLDTISPEVNLISPSFSSALVNDSYIFSANISDWNLTNMSFQLRNSSGYLINETLANISGTFNQTSILIYNLSNGTYNYSFTGFDFKSNSGSFNGTLTLSYSNITLISPMDGYSETSNSANLIFNFSLLKNFTNCSLFLDNVSVKNITVVDFTLNQNVSYTLGAGNYIWAINCSVDSLSEQTNSRSITISAPAVEQVTTRSSGGGGGGGGAAPITVVNQNQTNEGYTRVLGKQEIVQFVLFDLKSSKHTLTVNSIGKDYVNITIRSDPIKLTLGIGQSIKLNLTSAEFYDLYVKLENIVNGKAEITIQTINEPRLNTKEPERNVDDFNFTTMNQTQNEIPLGEENKSNNMWFYLLILVIFVVLTAIITHILDRRKRKRAWHID
ncbi:MAG TPA: S8 family serine peptidase [Candidatus Nanoarchaeia archaeon]|nr:S8 family serine peptidase [Candidatus Nanoarchaeia archaeon]